MRPSAAGHAADTLNMRSRRGYRDAEMLFELVTRVSSDTHPPHPADAAYLFGETDDNAYSVLEAGALIWSLRRVRRICIPAIKGPGFGGPEIWESYLRRRGVPENRIVRVPLAPDFPPGTDAEALGIVDWALKNRWESLYIAASPLHRLRAFLSAISALDLRKGRLDIFNLSGPAQPWTERVVHSQGIQRGIRSKLLHSELQKIERYHKKGDLVPLSRALAYLNKRDKERSR